MDIAEFVEEFERGKRAGRNVVRVDSVETAVELARALEAKELAHWFRGQTRNWARTVPSLHRPGQLPVEECLQGIERLRRWAASVPALAALSEKDDELIAVAQHYGLPTAFLDFSTSPDVAGFFASHAPTDPPAAGDESCILCLDTAEARDIWDAVRTVHGQAPELLELTVPNLWRLEAQRGVFVWSPFDDLDGPYPLDRIVFPYRGPIARPSVEEIYPERQSPLEAKLREYFQAESIRRGQGALDEFAQRIGARELDFEGPAHMPEHFTDPLTRHASWDRAEDWLRPSVVTWEEVTRAKEARLELGDGHAVEASVLAGLASGELLRSEPTRWVVEPGPDREAETTLAATVLRVWDAMRSLPWSDADLAAAIGTTVSVFRAAWSKEPQGNGFSGACARKVAASLFDRPLRIELSPGGNIHSFAFVEQAKLLAAVRDDFEERIHPMQRDRIVGHPFNTLMVARTPSLLFDFTRLLALFPRQFVPTQAVFERDAPLFASPARLQAIGPE